MSIQASSWQAGQKLSTALLLAGLLLLLAACSTTRPSEQATAALADEWGIKITRLNLTANGYMVDFRYRVLDADKAAELFSRRNKPYLIHQETGKVVAVPNIGKVGPLRTTNMPREGKIYWMFFDNLSGLIKPGNRVTLIIGDFRVENQVVQ